MFFRNLFPGVQPLVMRIDRIRLPFILIVDAASIVVAFTLALLLRFEFFLTPDYTRLLKIALLVWPVSKVAAFALLRMQCRSWRHVSVGDLVQLCVANVLGSMFTAVVAIGLSLAVPRSVWIMDLLFCFLATAAVRFSVRLIAEVAELPPSRIKRRRAVVYGAGSAGIALVREIRQNPSLGYSVCGFVDDCQKKKGSLIYGMRVLGGGSELSALVAKYCVDIALIAIPSASGSQMCRILECCQAAGLETKTIPGIAERMGTNHLARQLRDVAVEDLLARSPVRLEQERIASKLQGRPVLVTGAAGSIGSELCRQIARFRPSCIVGYDTAETPLFQLQQEMARLFPDVAFFPAIGSIQNPRRLAEVFVTYRPSAVYHAAAYKHVPMMEMQSFEAIENNVFGTLNVALAADQFGAEDFVMISSDKAVRPTNIMGASKRLAELVIRSLQNGGLQYISVRFGNVLGSNGSVVPIFKEQIARGGPITVTHPEMRRFFMTIPEACQLVLQSSTMGNGGEIFVLDMGSSVRIVDLARNLILLSGLRPDKDIQIKFTGIRPGEKLHEELSSMYECTVPTYHEKIQIFAGETIPWPTLEQSLTQLQNACTAHNLDELILILKEIIPEYNPSSDLLRQALHRRPVAPPVGSPGQLALLPAGDAQKVRLAPNVRPFAANGPPVTIS